MRQAHLGRAPGPANEVAMTREAGAAKSAEAFWQGNLQADCPVAEKFNSRNCPVEMPLKPGMHGLTIDELAEKLSSSKATHYQGSSYHESTEQRGETLRYQPARRRG
jgi:hypothetical protein